MSNEPLDRELGRAREILRLPIRHGPAELRRAFREAAKRAHPDRPGGDPEKFRAVVEAFHILKQAESSPSQPRRPTRPAAAASTPPPEASPRRASAGPGSTTLSVSPLIAMTGGQIDHVLPGGALVRLSVPAGLRAGDTVRAGGDLLVVAVRGDGGMLVRGDDLWINVAVEPRLLVDGGRVALETPLGRRIVWITKKAGDRGLVRLVGQGLPPRGRRPAGHLFIRLSPLDSQSPSAAKSLLRRFTAAWAA